MDQRVFYSLLERVGGNGRYQSVLLGVWAVLMLVLGSTNFFLPFVFYQNDYQCHEGITNCKDYVCSLSSNQRTQFIHDDLYSLATKFGDYRCDNNVEIDRIQSFIYLGGVIGVLVGAFTNQIITKRKLLIVTVVANIVGLGFSLIGKTMFVSSIGLLINFAAAAIQIEIVQCYIVESVSEDVRGQHIMITFVFYSLGVTMNGLVFYLLKNWQTYILILIPVTMTVLLFLIFYVKETPFDLIINQSPQDSLSVLKWIGLANNREEQHKITLLELENVKRQFQENEQKKEHANISILDLFRYESLRTLTIVSLVLHYTTSYQFAAPEIAIRNYSLSIYTNGIVIGLAELIGSVVCYFIVDHYARKTIISITQVICLVSSVSVFFFFACNGGSCAMSTQILQTVGLTVFRFAATIAYNFFYMMQYEAFPNQIRGLALQFVCLPSYFAAVTLPQIIAFCNSTGISIVLSFVVCTVIVMVMMIGLPQTFGIPPPEIIEELKYEHREINEPKMIQKIKQT